MPETQLPVASATPGPPGASFSRRNAMWAALAVDLIAGHLGATRPIVLVSGFWRSGTTWMQELIASSLGAKTVFEPLSPLNPARRERLIAAGLLDRVMRETFIPGRADADDPMWPYLDAAFLGIAGSRVSVVCRHGVHESFRRAIVVKDVRLQANLEAVHRRYGVPVVHLRRDPCAVVSSLLSANWYWSFADARLAPMMEPFLEADIAEQVRDCDVDAVSRIAAYWAVTERLVERSLRGRPWAAIVAYEDAVLDPDTAIRDVCRLIGRDKVRVGDPNLDSATTFGASRGTPSRLRRDAWRGRLSTTDVDRIYRIVNAIFPEALASLGHGTGGPSRNGSSIGTLWQ